MIPVFGEWIPLKLVYVLMGLVLVSMLVVRLRTVLFLTLIALTLPSLDTELNALSRYLRWAFLAGLVGKGLLVNLSGGIMPRPRVTEHSIVLSFCFLFLVSATWSIGSTITLAQGAMMVMVLAGVFIVLWNSWSSEEEILGLCDVLFRVAAVIFTLELVYQVQGLGHTYGRGRYAGVFLNPNGLGTAVAFLGPFVYWKHRSSVNALLRTFCKALGVMMAIGLLQSGSRSGFLGTVICMGFIACYVYRVKLTVLVACLTIPVFLLYVVSRDMDTSAVMGSRLVRVDTLATLSDRLPMWEDGLDLIVQRPFLGYGYAMSKFANLGRADFDLSSAVYSMRGYNYHSAHLQVAVDLGIVGLLLFWFFLYSVLRRGFSLYAKGVRDPLHLAGIVFFAAFFSLAGDSFVHGWAFSPGSSMAIVFYLVAAATVRIHVFTRERDFAATEPEEDGAELNVQERLPVASRR